MDVSAVAVLTRGIVNILGYNIFNLGNSDYALSSL